MLQRLHVQYSTTQESGETVGGEGNCEAWEGNDTENNNNIW